MEAMQARHRLGLALAGRLREEEVTRAWKRAAAEHHPDRGGAHGTMQAINAARVLLLGLDSD
jgi:DnaJ-class molecular chaperone